MKSKAVFMGHPIHPMLIPFPFAFLTGACLFDAAGWFFQRAAWWTTGGHLAIAGVITALVAAVPGLVDYLYTVPPKSSGKTRATKHMLSNLSSVAVFGLAVLIRGNSATPPAIAVLALELMGLGLLVFAGYLGGTLVTRNLISVDHRYANTGKWQEETFKQKRGNIVVAKRDDLKLDQMKLLRIGEKRIVLARTGRGFVAFDDHCTHRGGSLAGGIMLCGTVQCLWHGSRFDVHSGAVKGGPAEQPISTYRITEDDDDVTLTL